jgi:glycosyltransferase involved in cell wall biosynthesis
MPAHNEEHRLPPVLEAYARLFSERMGADAEILLVANGSTDRTASVAAEIAEKFTNIKVIDEPRRIGKGGAVILGAKQALGEYIGFVDADGATSAGEFFRLFTIVQNSDGVIASRWMRGSDVTIPQKGLRLFSSRIFNLLIRTVLGLKYKDTQCGAKIFRAEAWERILPNIGITRFAFDVDILFQLKRNGFTIREEPTTWRDIEGSKVHVLSSSFDMFSAVIRMRLLYSPFRFIVKIYERFFSKLVEFLRKDELFSHAMFLFMASLVAHVCNILYQMFVSRALSKTEFALLTMFLALYAIVARPLSTLGTAINHYSSLLKSEGRLGGVKRLLAKWLGLTGMPSLILAGTCVIFAKEIAAFFHLERSAPVVVCATALPALFLTPVLGGAIRGLQHFGWAALAAIFGAVVRVLVGAALVFLLYPVCGWALLGHVVGLYVSIVITVIALYFLLHKYQGDRSSLPSMRFYLVQCFFIQICTSILLTGDVVLVKHYLPDETDFAYAATLGRMVVFLTVAISAAMFPKVASTGAFTRAHRRIYFYSQLYTFILVAVSVIACSLFPELLHRVLFRITDPSPHLLSLTRWMAWVMAFATLLNINVALLLAQRRFRLASVTVISTIAMLVYVHCRHESAYQIIAAIAVAVLSALVITTVGIFHAKEKVAGG